MTVREKKKKLNRLRAIEKERLRFSRRWKSVEVEIIDNTIVLKWSDPTEHNPGWYFHEKERPLHQLDYLIQYHGKKLKEKL